MRRSGLVVLGLVALVLVAGCGGEERADNAVEAQEGNTVTLGGLSYRAVLFRELNPSVAPDDAILDGRASGGDAGLYGLFLTACNETDAPVRADATLRLEDAFGAGFDPKPELTADRYEYRGGTVAPGECLPGEGSAADRLVDGSAAVFQVPFDKLSNRPFILELSAGGERRRVQLDL